MVRSNESQDRDFVGFRLRGREVTRLESFSHAVFGFALTLLVVSLDVPKSFADLVSTMRGFPAFAICFLLLALIWNGHYKFCRRYGLDDGTARFLTCVMLFLVLFYVYPLKFLFNLSITALLFGAAPPAARATSPWEARTANPKMLSNTVSEMFFIKEYPDDRSMARYWPVMSTSNCCRNLGNTPNDWCA